MNSQRQALWRKYREVREHSHRITSELRAEDQAIQSMPDASPVKWHLAHTTWFFETMILQPFMTGYQVFNPQFAYLFNSYYEAIGPRQPRPKRGLLSRPTIGEVHAYRQHVNNAMETLIANADDMQWQEIEQATILGLNHEQQHQELIITDIVHAFSCNPLLPACWSNPEVNASNENEIHARLWLKQSGGMTNIGFSGTGFAFDNESPSHPVWLQPYAIADRLVTCGEYLQFIDDGGYQRPEFWLSDGWATVQQSNWTGPLYWLGDSKNPVDDMATGERCIFGVHGAQPLVLHAPVMNVSFYEADAYASWAEARLPTEFEWEAACNNGEMKDMFGHVWQWTQSSYSPYPGFKPLPGIAAEYNGKFMVGQQVLRGSSFATPQGHSRTTYRNFFPASTRWQFSGIRLARDI